MHGSCARAVVMTGDRTDGTVGDVERDSEQAAKATEETPVLGAFLVPEPEEEAVDEEAEARARVTKVADHIRSESRAARVTPLAAFLEEPFGYDEEQLDLVWETFAIDEAYADIVRTPSERDGSEFLHSTRFLTVPYAKLLLRSQADDPVFLIAQTVRENAEIYPRATSVEYFLLDPFNLQLEDVFAHIATMKATEAYADVKSVTVSNGMVYLYSDRFLTEPQAQSLAQWDEVDSHLLSNQ